MGREAELRQQNEQTLRRITLVRSDESKVVFEGFDVQLDLQSKTAVFLDPENDEKVFVSWKEGEVVRIKVLQTPMIQPVHGKLN